MKLYSLIPTTLCALCALAACAGDGADSGVVDATAGDTGASADTQLVGVQDAGADTLVDAGDVTNDTTAAADTSQLALCPPAGPFGTDVDDVLADLTLTDCDGNPYPIHALCGRPAAVLTTYAGW